MIAAPRRIDGGNGMAKAPASDSIMTADKMKPLLALSKQEPVQAAIGLTADGEGLLLLDKKAKPKKVLSMLRASAGKAKLQLANASLRFGRAEVDTDYDSGMVRLFINKDAPGNMRIKLVEVVKRVPYQKVEINVDPSLEEESEEDEAPAAAAPAPAAAAPAPPPPPSAAAPAAPAAPDGQALRRALAELIGRIPAAAGEDAARKATLLKVAGMANDQIKSGNAAAAAGTIEKLRQVLGTPAPARPAGAVVRVAQALLLWNDTRSHVAQQIKTLQQAIIDQIPDDPDYEEIKANLGNLEELLEWLDDSLGDKLNALRGTTDAAEKVKLSEEARQIVIGFQQRVASDGLMNEIDDNGFIALDIKPRVTAALAGVLDAI
jgi:hypothetical protein